MNNLTWTAERVDLLTAMRERGPKVIWAALNELPGPALTKSAVVGKRDRLFGVRQPKKTEEEKEAVRRAKFDRGNAARRAKRAEQRAPINFNRVAVAKNRIDPEPFICQEPVDVVPLNIPFSELERGDHKCRWPYDAPEGASGSFVFCGHPGEPYCCSHARIAYRQPQARTKAPYLDLGKSAGGIFRRTA